MDIFTNPLIKKIALKKLRDYMTDNKISCITVTINPSGEIDFTPHEGAGKYVTQAELSEIQKLIKNNIQL